MSGLASALDHMLMQRPHSLFGPRLHWNCTRAWIRSSGLRAPPTHNSTRGTPPGHSRLYSTTGSVYPRRTWQSSRKDSSYLATARHPSNVPTVSSTQGLILLAPARWSGRGSVFGLQSRFSRLSTSATSIRNDLESLPPQPPRKPAESASPDISNTTEKCLESRGELDHPPPLPIQSPAVVLSNEQRFLLNKVIKEKKSVFFTGSAGTGKSVLLRQLIHELKEHELPGKVAVTASTGIAACNIGGCTLHSFAGIGLGQGTIEQLLVKLGENKRARARWKKIKVLIIDEISMIDADTFDKLEKIARVVKKSNKPFGGIQLILTGDFFQLPPVFNDRSAIYSLVQANNANNRIDGEGDIFTPSTLEPKTVTIRHGPEGEDIPIFMEEHDVSSNVTLAPQYQPPKLCFDAESWNECIQHTLQLTEVFRQRDPTFIKMLNEARHGHLSEESCQVFKDLERDPEYPSDGIKPTELFALRKQVDESNFRYLDELRGPVYVYEPIDSGPLSKFMGQFTLAPTKLQLKVNAQVMLIKNLSPSLVNGSMGIVVGFQSSTDYDTESKQWITSHFPIIRFSGEEDDLVIRPEEWKMELPNGDLIASRVQLPLILAWALSIHKSQGQTIERVKVDMENIFEAGQAYVALSRATNLAGLQVLNFNKKSIHALDRVGEFYEGLKTVQKTMEEEEVEKARLLELKASKSKRKKKKTSKEAVTRLPEVATPTVDTPTMDTPTSVNDPPDLPFMPSLAPSLAPSSPPPADSWTVSLESYSKTASPEPNSSSPQKPLEQPKALPDCVSFPSSPIDAALTGLNHVSSPPALPVDRKDRVKSVNYSTFGDEQANWSLVTRTKGNASTISQESVAANGNSSTPTRPTCLPTTPNHPQPPSPSRNTDVGVDQLKRIQGTGFKSCSKTTTTVIPPSSPLFQHFARIIQRQTPLLHLGQSTGSSGRWVKPDTPLPVSVSDDAVRAVPPVGKWQAENKNVDTSLPAFVRDDAILAVPPKRKWQGEDKKVNAPLPAFVSDDAVWTNSSERKWQGENKNVDTPLPAFVRDDVVQAVPPERKWQGEDKKVNVPLPAFVSDDAVWTNSSERKWQGENKNVDTSLPAFVRDDAILAVPPERKWQGEDNKSNMPLPGSVKDDAVRTTPTERKWQAENKKMNKPLPAFVRDNAHWTNSPERKWQTENKKVSMPLPRFVRDDAVRNNPSGREWLAENKRANKPLPAFVRDEAAWTNSPERKWQGEKKSTTTSYPSRTRGSWEDQRDRGSWEGQKRSWEGQRDKGSWESRRDKESWEGQRDKRSWEGQKSRGSWEDPRNRLRPSSSRSIKPRSSSEAHSPNRDPFREGSS